MGKSGVLYGTTADGGADNSCLPFEVYSGGCGAAFELAPPAVPGGPWTETVLYSFGPSPDAELPITSMVFGTNGVLYGTSLGGANGSGSLFQLTPPAAAGANWTESVINSFDLPYTWGPQGTLLLAPDGTLYGTTSGDAMAQQGKLTDWGATVYALFPPATAGGSWTRSILYRFGSAQEGAGTFPRAGLVASQGLLFGTDYAWGNTSCEKYGCGAIFELQPPASQGSPWTETSIYQFNGAPGDGGGPLAALTVGQGGMLYGTTQYGGSSTLCTLNNVVVGCGTVFQLTPPATGGGAWTETVLYSFTGQDGDGALPVASLVLGKNGSLYGTTEYGGSAASGSACVSFGASGCGTVFELKPPAAPGGSLDGNRAPQLHGQGWRRGSSTSESDRRARGRAVWNDLVRWDCGLRHRIFDQGQLTRGGDTAPLRYGFRGVIVEAFGTPSHTCKPKYGLTVPTNRPWPGIAGGSSCWRTRSSVINWPLTR